MKLSFLGIILLFFVGSFQLHAADEPVQVRFITNQGDIELTLDPVNAPITVANFLNYVDQGFYDGLIFHRVIPNFMIQAGGFDVNLQRKETAAPIANESTNGLSNTRGTIAMARTNDPDSATSQFFINVANNGNLDGHPLRPGYAVFGEVSAGHDVVFAISRMQTRSRGGHQNVPTTPVIIERAERVQQIVEE